MSEEKVGPKGEPIAVGHFNEVPINRLVRADGGEISYAELRHWAACVNALHEAGITNPEALPRAMEVVAARAISSPEIDAALAALRREG